jgi:hypothetical protein
VENSFEESRRRWTTTCLYCRESCECSEDVKELAMGHVAHRHCYDQWQKGVDKQLLPIGVTYRAVLPVVRLPGEEKLSTDQVSRRRHTILRKRMRKKP